MLRDLSYFAMDAYCSPLHRAAAILNIYSFIIEWIAKRSNYLAGNQLEVNGAAGVRARDPGAAILPCTHFIVHWTSSTDH